jgi:hypothetical protein
MEVLIENSFDDNFSEGRDLGMMDAEAGLPNRFLMDTSKFGRGYKEGFRLWISQNEEERKKKEKQFKARCPYYGKSQEGP